MADLLLIRHASPEQKGVFLGRSDPALSLEGIQEASRIAVPTEIELVYSSPLRRARETAAALGRPVEILPGLAEIDYGPWEGLSWAQIEARFPLEAERKMQDWLGYTVAGAEPWSAFSERVLAALPRGRNCIVVAHLAVNSVIHHHLSGGSPLNFQQDYCQILQYQT